MGNRRTYFYKPIRTTVVEAALTPETAPDRLLWLDPAFGVMARTGAVQFTAGNQSRLQVANNATVQAAPRFWLASWVQFDSLSTSRIFLGKDNTTSIREYSLLYTSVNNCLRFSVSNTGSSLNNQLNGTNFGSPGTGIWRFVMGYYDQTAGRMGISVDGAAFQTMDVIGAPFTGTAPLDFGTNNASYPHDGRLDQVALGKAPSASFDQIRDALYNGGSGRTYNQLTSSQKTDFGLVSFWEMEELTGTRNDSHGTNHLTALNNPTATDGAVDRPAVALDPVRSWTDREAATVFIQDIVAQRPIWHAEPSLAFDGVNDCLNRVGPLIGHRPEFTLFAKFQANSFPTTNPAVLFTEANASGSVVNRLAISDQGSLIASYRPSGGTLISTSSAEPIVLEDQVVVAVRRQGTGLQLFVDGIPAGPAAVIDPGTSLDGATLRIGGPVESSGLSHFQGRIFSLFAVGQALSHSQIASLSSNL